jgi:magnesium chelatase family protein
MQHTCTSPAASRRRGAGVSTVGRYQKRLSGPLLDRIDIHVEMPRVDYDKLSDCEAS